MNYRRIHLLRIAAASLALAALDAGPTAADLIEVHLLQATYEEEIYYSKGPLIPDDRVSVAKGADSELAETVQGGTSYSKGSFTFVPSHSARAGFEGPTAAVLLSLSSSLNDPDVFYAGTTSWRHSAWVHNRYQVAVVNWEGTTWPYVVPVRVQGTLAVSGTGSPGAPWDLDASAAVRLFEDYENGLGDFLGGIVQEVTEKQLDSKSFSYLIPIPVAVGRNPGDFFTFWVIESAFAGLQVRAEYYRDFPQDAWLGSGTAFAYADPHIYIDPTWEFADRYRLVFSPNVENAVPEPGGAVLMLTGVAFLAGLARPWRRRAGQRSSCSKVA